MAKVKLELELEEVNLILKSLGNLPFKEVFELIGKINQQANQQLKDDPHSKGDEASSKINENE